MSRTLFTPTDLGGGGGGGLKGNTRGEESFSRFALAIGDFSGG